MNDKYARTTSSLIAPAGSSFVITPDDSASLPVISKALYVGTGGDLTIQLVHDASDRVFKNVANGAILDVRASHVRATGTTAADIVGLA